MTTPITATLPAGYTPPTSSAASASGSGLNGVNANTFLNLLVAQLKYQDPSNPTDPTQMLSQTAMFQEVQQLSSLQTSMNSLGTSMTSVLASQQATSAASMLGQQITALGADGVTPISGIVSGVQLTSSGPVLTVGSSTVPLSSVQTISKPTAA